MAGNSYSQIPGGNILCSTFVKLDPSNTGNCLQCGAGDRVYGISQAASRRIALDAYDTPYCGILGDPAINIFGPNSSTGVPLVINGTVSAGDYLKPDSSGYGITTTTHGDQYGARALASGTAGQIIPVEVIIGYIGQ